MAKIVNIKHGMNRNKNGSYFLVCVYLFIYIQHIMYYFIVPWNHIKIKMY